MSLYNEALMYNGQDPVDTEVHHDSTLSGDGSVDDPLSVNYAKVRYVNTTDTYSKIRGIIDDGYQPVLELFSGSYHNYLVCTHKSGTHIDFIGNTDRLSGGGDGSKGLSKVSVDNNNQWSFSNLLPTCYDYTGLAGKFLRVNNAETEPSWEDLNHDSTLIGNGTSSNPLSVSTASTVTSGDTTHVPTADAVSSYAVAQDEAGYRVHRSSIGEGDWKSSVPNITNKTVSISIPANSTKWIKIPGCGIAGELLNIGFKYGSSNCYMTLTVEVGERPYSPYSIKVINKFGNPSLSGGVQEIGLSDQSDGGNGPWLYIKVSNMDSQARSVSIASTRTHDIIYELIDDKDKVTSTYVEISREINVLEQTQRVVYDGKNSVYANGAVGSVEQPVFVDSGGELSKCPKRRIVAKSSSFNLNNEYSADMIGETITVVNGYNGDVGITVSYLDINNRSRQALVSGGFCVRFVCVDPQQNLWAADE